MILERYYPSKKSRTKGENHCNYFGHLEFDQEACVSVTGCYGKDNLEFTINSKHSGLNNMFIMTANGNVESVESALNVIMINIFCKIYTFSYITTFFDRTKNSKTIHYMILMETFHFLEEMLQLHTQIKIF